MVANQGRVEEIRVIADNLYVHKNAWSKIAWRRTQSFAFASPSYFPLLNRVELWFCKIERGVIARRVLSSCLILRESGCVTSPTTTKLLGP